MATTGCEGPNLAGADVNICTVQPCSETIHSKNFYRVLYTLIRDLLLLFIPNRKKGTIEL